MACVRLLLLRRVQLTWPWIGEVHDKGRLEEPGAEQENAVGSCYCRQKQVRVDELHYAGHCESVHRRDGQEMNGRLNGLLAMHVGVEAERQTVPMATITIIDPSQRRQSGLKSGSSWTG